MTALYIWPLMAVAFLIGGVVSVALLRKTSGVHHQSKRRKHHKR